MCGLFVKTKYWNYILDGGLVSSLIEELIARFILYEVRYRGFNIYMLVAIITSLPFVLLHFGYEPSALLARPNIIPKLSQHVGFCLMLRGIFCFVPRLKAYLLSYMASLIYVIPLRILMN